MRSMGTLFLVAICACSSSSGDAATDDPIDEVEAVCGDGVLEEQLGEACDLSAAAASCGAAGHWGWASCSDDCVLDTSYCYGPLCGNGVVDDGEDCDSSSDCSESCTLLGDFAELDSEVRALMDAYDIPGGAVAITKDGALVFTRGYGETVDAATRFRIGSVSKPVTSVAAHLLAERGELDLDARVLDLVEGATLPAGLDSRWQDITVRHLLSHRAGFSTDPMFDNIEVAAALGIEGPASARDMLRYMLGRPLDYDPGQVYDYSNFGFALAGIIIEDVSGLSYQDYVRDEVFAPMGIDRIVPGYSRLEDRQLGEAPYYTRPDRSLSQSVFPGEGEVPHTYGGFYIESMTALGGWVASAPNLARFLVHVDGLSSVPDLLDGGTTEDMVSKPAGANPDSFYAHGWFVQPTAGGEIWSHAGVLSGTRALVIRYPSGMNVVALFNLWPPGDFSTDLVEALTRGLGEVQDWPARDLFDYFP
jgi:N-acyl-D-amino-acid deacylase